MFPNGRVMLLDAWTETTPKTVARGSIASFPSAERLERVEDSRADETSPAMQCLVKPGVEVLCSAPLNC